MSHPLDCSWVGHSSNLNQQLSTINSYVSATVSLDDSVAILNVSKVGFRNSQKHFYMWTILLLCEYLKKTQNLNSKNWITLCSACAIFSCKKSTEQYWLWFLSSITCTKYFIQTNYVKILQLYWNGNSKIYYAYTKFILRWYKLICLISLLR